MSARLYLRADESVAPRLDPFGNLRRMGELDLTRVPVAVSASTWTPKTDAISYRVWDGKLWQREVSAYFFGGYRIKTIPIGTRIAAEWLS